MLHTNTNNGFQIMSYAHVEKDLNRYEQLNFKFENKAPHYL